MWEWFQGLPWLWQIVIYFSTLIATVLVAIFGRLAYRNGSLSLGFKRKRSCGDCFMFIRNKIVQNEREIEKKESKILKDQMNFSAQKLIELQKLIMTWYSDKMRAKRDPSKPNTEDESIQYRMFYGIIRDAVTIGMAKDEFRRAFKENGFSSMGDKEFSDYIRDEIDTIINLIGQHITNMYPNATQMIVPLDEISNLNPLKLKINDIIFEIFIKAKEIFIQTQSEIKELENDCNKELQEFIGVSS